MSEEYGALPGVWDEVNGERIPPLIGLKEELGLGEVRWRELDREILRLRAAAAVLEIREKELLDLKGPCSSKECRLHFAHSGPCDTRRSAPDAGGSVD